MKFVSPAQRGTTWRWTWSVIPAPAARPRFQPRLSALREPPETSVTVYFVHHGVPATAHDQPSIHRHSQHERDHEAEQEAPTRTARLRGPQQSRPARAG